MTRQEIFDKCFQHFVINKAPLALIGPDCCYRTAEGHKCAIGLFLPENLPFDPLSRKGLSMSVMDLISDFPTMMRESFFDKDERWEEHTMFLRDVQYCLHDGLRNSVAEDARYVAYQYFAQKYNLICPLMEIPS